MPHFGLIDENLPEKEQYLLRARLHIRGGIIRIRRGDNEDGIAALYDAFIHSLYWFYLSDEKLRPLLTNEKGNYESEEELYTILLKNGKINGNFRLEQFKELLDKALTKKLENFNFESFFKNFEDLMTQLKIMPFNESDLPKGPSITL
jgi:hypothetical protein